MYFITLPVLVRTIFTFYVNYVLLFKSQVPGPKFNINVLVWRLCAVSCRLNCVQVSFEIRQTLHISFLTFYLNSPHVVFKSSEGTFKKLRAFY